ncbi:UNVERIFIED_CONTAM: hypothetical protein HDU68_008048 [Siphonaria sp. JEL0065]|nr:hypothetical protein HDU68_008048 [Siphonaria sp. JEL0065]
MKEAQKAHRARKAEYFRDLENLVNILKRENNDLKDKIVLLEGGVSSTEPSGHPKCLFCNQKDARIRSLEAQLNELELEWEDGIEDALVSCQPIVPPQAVTQVHIMETSRRDISDTPNG